MICFQSKMNSTAKQMMACQASCKNYQWLRKYITSKTRVSAGKEKASYFFSFLITFNGPAADSQQGRTWRKMCAVLSSG